MGALCVEHCQAVILTLAKSLVGELKRSGGGAHPLLLNLKLVFEGLLSSESVRYLSKRDLNRLLVVGDFGAFLNLAAIEIRA